MNIFKTRIGKRSAVLLSADCRGASAAEFAIVAPLLLMMLAIIFTIGMFLRAHHAVAVYAREAARGVAIGYMTPAEAKQFAETHAQNDLRVVVTANVDPATKGDATDPDVVVMVSITQEEMAKLTPFGNWVPGGVRSVVVMRSTAE